MKVPNKQAIQAEGEIDNSSKSPPVQAVPNTQISSNPSSQVTGSNFNAFQTKQTSFNGEAQSLAYAASKSYPKPIQLTSLAQSILTRPAPQIPISVQAADKPHTAQVRKPEQVPQANNMKHAVPQHTGVRATLDDLINAADTLECGSEVANLTQVYYFPFISFRRKNRVVFTWDLLHLILSCRLQQNC